MPHLAGFAWFGVRAYYVQRVLSKVPLAALDTAHKRIVHSEFAPIELYG
jgi:hypothetical protein